MSRTFVSFLQRLFPFASIAVVYVSLSVNAASHQTVTQPGGMPVVPVMTGVHVSSNKVTVTWEGVCPPYRLLQKRALTDPTWQTVTGSQLSNSAIVSATFSNAFFRVSGTSPRFAGSQACAECHGDIHASEMTTAHAGAFETLKSIGQATNASCLPCHTVGFGLSTGFVSEKKTPQLAGVQCENCHGPAALHAANENDISARPRVDIASQICGGCHTGNQPQYDEWITCPHNNVVEDMNPSNRINSCGRCHSGTARLALMKGEDPVVTVTGDANVPIVCITCHDPHRTTANPYQLRNPLTSTNNYSLSTSATFTNAYNPNINICGQCHNDRGASWTSTSRSPHHSAQYNLLLGFVGEVTNNVAHRAGTHGKSMQKQCVSCHMQTDSDPVNTGHSFTVNNYAVCTGCHGDPQGKVDSRIAEVSARIQSIKASLDNWALTKAPLLLRTKYGVLAWEYSTPGELSSGPAGPNSTEQAQIPDTIKKARYNLYIINNEGTYGIHNPNYSDDLLKLAEDWIQEAMNN